MFINLYLRRHSIAFTLIALSAIAAGCASSGEAPAPAEAEPPVPVVESAPTSNPVPVASSRTIATEPRVISAAPAPARPNASNEGAMSVLEAQRKLTELGLQPGPIDGYMGPRTAAAIRQFQRNERIAQSGVLDAGTSARLRTARR